MPKLINVTELKNHKTPYVSVINKRKFNDAKPILERIPMEPPFAGNIAFTRLDGKLDPIVLMKCLYADGHTYYGIYIPTTRQAKEPLYLIEAGSSKQCLEIIPSQTRLFSYWVYDEILIRDYKKEIKLQREMDIQQMLQQQSPHFVDRHPSHPSHAEMIDENPHLHAESWLHNFHHPENDFAQKTQELYRLQTPYVNTYFVSYSLKGSETEIHTAEIILTPQQIIPGKILDTIKNYLRFNYGSSVNVLGVNLLYGGILPQTQQRQNMPMPFHAYQFMNR